MHSKLLFLLISTLIMGFIQLDIQASGWSTETLDRLQEIDSKYSQTNSGAISLWGATKRILSVKKIKGRSRKINLPKYFQKKSIDVYFQKRKKSDTLLLYLPGFTGAHSKTLKRETIVEDALHKYGKLKKNVISIPNFMSPMYWKRSPIFKKNTLSHHLETSYQILIEALKKFKLTHIKKLIIVSESLGAFTALSIRSRLIADKKMKPAQIKNLLLWPPFNLKKSIQNIDHQVLSNKEMLKSCNWYKLSPKIFYHFIWQRFPKNMSANFQTCIDSYVYSKAFLGKAFKSLKVFQKKNKQQLTSGETLSDFINGMGPAILESINKNPMSELSSWIKKTDEDFIYIITSNNDFINSQDAFKEFSKAHTYVLKKGGHVGYYPLLPLKSIFKDLERD